MTKVWILFGDKVESRFVLGVYSSFDLAKRDWLKYYEKNNPYSEFSDEDEIWWVNEQPEESIEEFEVKEEWFDD